MHELIVVPCKEGRLFAESGLGFFVASLTDWSTDRFQNFIRKTKKMKYPNRLLKERNVSFGFWNIWNLGILLSSPNSSFFVENHLFWNWFSGFRWISFVKRLPESVAGVGRPKIRESDRSDQLFRPWFVPSATIFHYLKSTSFFSLFYFSFFDGFIFILTYLFHSFFSIFLSHCYFFFALKMASISLKKFVLVFKIS